MKRFSERMGITKPPEIQLNSMNQTLRNSLWNLVLKYLDGLREEYETGLDLDRALYGDVQKARTIFIRDVARSFFRDAVDEVKNPPDVAQQWLKNKFYSLEWHGVYNFIEFLVQNSREYFRNARFLGRLNNILEEENCGYRFINRQFVPITSEQEIKEIEEAIEESAKVGIDGAREHLSSALSLLARKPEPDYRNSIKESISAVESVVKLISGERDGGLDKALKKLSEKTDIHGALEQGFLKLYGYTSDEDGIRHSILEKSNVGLDEAKFMLVSCSAFINYLISKADKAGLLKETNKVASVL